MLHLLQQTLGPALSLKQSVNNWFDISCALRESPRERAMKMEEIEAEK